MSIKDTTNHINSPQILPFPVENHTPQLSINTDDKYFRLFYIKYYSMVYRRCRTILRNNEDAQDMAQKVFICIHRLSSKGEFDILRQKPEPYLNKAARNMSLNEIKRKRSELNKLYDFATSESIKGLISKFENGQMVKEQYITDSDYEQVEAEIIIEAILAEQDETTRKIYFYKYHDDMVLKQIGELVGLKKSAVQKRIKKLEKQVKAVLGKVKK